MTSPIPVIDLFAGPGGLNEGFSSVRDEEGNPAFQTVGSFEMESTAVRTLTLRGVYRHLERNGGVPTEYYEFIRGELSWDAFISGERVSAALEVAKTHVHQVELGGVHDTSDVLIRAALTAVGAIDDRPWALIGGPPCQAYSLAGRSRRANDETFAQDKKHFLYREYLRIIRTFSPPVFVMENVKGLLSSTTSGVSMFDLIKRDLERPKAGLEYDIHSLVSDDAPENLSPDDFIIRAEQYGVPQKRHRVILLGIKRGFLREEHDVGTLPKSDQVTVGDALAGMKPLRSGISPASQDNPEAWAAIRRERSWGSDANPSDLDRGRPSTARTGSPSNSVFAEWIIDPNLQHVIQHETRSHMAEDLRRYRYAAIKADKDGVSPKLGDFPEALLPNHKNAASATRPFEDRFRVQIRDSPSTTIVSHISKDGHYYIHHDPDQMRSLTVREAARLQSFPDNYFFMGNRTQQYHQVGNAVPPLLAKQIAEVVARLFTGH